MIVLTLAEPSLPGNVERREDGLLYTPVDVVPAQLPDSAMPSRLSGSWSDPEGMGHLVAAAELAALDVFSMLERNHPHSPSAGACAEELERRFRVGALDPLAFREELEEELDAEGSGVMFEWLLRIDRTRALRFAEDLLANRADDYDPDEPLVLLCAGVACFPNPGDVERRLDALGVTARPPAESAESAEPADTLFSALRRRGRLIEVGAEDGHLPVDHPRLLHILASSVAPALDGARFTQEVLFDVDGDIPEHGAEGYRVSVFTGERRYTATLLAYRDYYDAQGGIGLLNAVLEGEGSTWRALSLDVEDAVSVVGAPRGALEALRRSGVLA